MELEAFTYRPGIGWSQPLSPALDSESTLVVVFGSPDLEAVAGPLDELVGAFPKSHLIGWSTAGEIFDTDLSDAGLSVAVVRFRRTRLASAFAATPDSGKSFQASEDIARKLGERAEEEIEATLDVLPENTRQIGFYSYGEISPHTTGHCDLHNQTMTLTTISER